MPPIDTKQQQAYV